MSLAAVNQSPRNGEKPEIMTLREVAAFLRCHPSMVYRLANRGEIPAFKLSSEWRFSRSDIEKWLRNRIKKRTSPNF